MRALELRNLSLLRCGLEVHQARQRAKALGVAAALPLGLYAVARAVLRQAPHVVAGLVQQRLFRRECGQPRCGDALAPDFAQTPQAVAALVHGAAVGQLGGHQGAGVVVAVAGDGLDVGAA